MNKLLLCIISLIFLGSSGWAYDSVKVKPINVLREDEKGNTIGFRKDLKELTVTLLPQIDDQPPLLKFSLDGPKKNFPVAWFKKGVSSYNYYFDNESGKVYWMVYLMTPEMNVSVSLSVPDGYNGNGSVYFMYYSMENGEKRLSKVYEALLAPDETKKVFPFVIDAIKSLSLSKFNKDTLPPVMF